MKMTYQQVMSLASAAVTRYGTFLGLDRPISIGFSNSKKFYGRYETELLVEDYQISIVHNITLSMRYALSGELINSTMAHELIHAWQAENALDIDHGEEFQKMARAILMEFSLDVDMTIQEE